jgi:hypothetical protein
LRKTNITLNFRGSVGFKEEKASKIERVLKEGDERRRSIKGD